MKNNSRIITLILMSYISFNFAQTYALRQVMIIKTNEPPSINGKLDDKIWQSAPTFSAFKTMFPDYGLNPSEKTEVYIAYDNSNLYVAVRCLDSEPDKIKASVTKRDNISTDDWVCIELDTLNTAQSNNFFMVNPLGIQADGMLNQNDEEDLSFDTVWFSKGTRNKNGYEVEIKIPFKSLRFPYGKEIIIGMAVRRSIGRKSEIVTFPEYDPQKGSRLMQRYNIVISEIKYDPTIEIIPALTFNRSSSHTAGKWQESSRLNDFSLTGKMGITPELTLDATYNPDFSHVESDVGQVDINLRYALFFPEKRSFFLEGQEHFIFASSNIYGTPLEHVVNTRTIVDPLMGLKLTGKVSDKNTISILFALDEYPKKIALDAGNSEIGNATISIVRYKRGLKKDSYIGGIYTDTGHSGTFNRLIGSDGRFCLSGKSIVEYHAFASFTKNDETANTNTGGSLGILYSYLSRRIQLKTGLYDVTKDFGTDVGYLTRTGITLIPMRFYYKIYPKSAFFQRVEIHVTAYNRRDKYSSLYERFNRVSLHVYMPRQTELYFGINPDRNEIFSSKRFDRSGFNFGGNSQITKQLYWKCYIELSKRIYYDTINPYQGKGTTATVELIFQPTEKLNSSLRYTFESFYRHSDGEKIYNYSIMRNKTTYQFNKYLFFRGIMEYNDYYKRINTDFLASFTYIPGTVIQIGYGSIYEKIHWSEQEYLPSDDYLQTSKTFFFKTSYLWRF